MIVSFDNGDQFHFPNVPEKTIPEPVIPEPVVIERAWIRNRAGNWVRE